MILQFPKRRRPVCPVDELLAASRRAELRAEAIQKIVEHNRAAVGKIQVRADERVVVLKVRQPDGGMK